MGSFITNFHVLTSDAESVRSGLETLGRDSRILGSSARWTSFTDGDASSQNTDAIEALAAQLSALTGNTVLAFMVHDSDLLCAWVSEGGAVIGRLETWPGWPDDEPPDKVAVPDALVALGEGVSREQFEAAASAHATFADDTLVQLAGMLDIPQAYALSDHRQPDMPGPGAGRPAASAAAKEMEDLLGALGGGDAGGMMAGLQEQLRQAMGPAPEVTSGAAKDLVDAAAAGNLARVSELLAAGADPDGIAGWRPSQLANSPMAAMMPELAVTPAYAAASEGHAAVLELLFESDADPDLRVPRGDTPLAAAATNGHPDAVEAVLDAGADPSGPTANGATVLQMLQAARAQIAQMQAMLGNMPMGMPGMPKLPSAERLDACEALIREELE